ncbi:5094_t:CDS:2, partial [Acaulospora colombiana]
TGKSVLLRTIIKSMRKKYFKSSDAVAVTASTGIAACNIGGITLHSFGGVGLGTETAPELAGKVRKNPKANTRWIRTKVLIIDEKGDFFDKLEQVARLVRKRPEPFGGIQASCISAITPVGQVKFAFHANTWKECVDHTFNLTRVFRQKDQDFVEMLNEMRFGRLSQKSIQAFMARSRPLPNDGIEPTELFPRREDVDRANKERLDRLEGESYTYNAQDGGLADERSRNTMLNNFMAPKSLLLKVNAQ